MGLDEREMPRAEGVASRAFLELDIGMCANGRPTSSRAKLGGRYRDGGSQAPVVRAWLRWFSFARSDQVDGAGDGYGMNRKNRRRK